MINAIPESGQTRARSVYDGEVACASIGAESRLAKDGPSWQVETAQHAAGYEVVAGCDEAGRGPLAGPVVAAAVILPREIDLPGLNDSKKLDEPARERLYPLVREQALAVGVGLSCPEEIDALNILRASLLAMRRAVQALALRPDMVLIDGNQRVPELGCEQITVVDGDATSLSISAASIIAKVTRDQIMVKLDRLYPGYGFAGHKGYGSPQHRAALQRLGACPIHRTSFAPVRAVMDAPPPLPPAKTRGATAQQLSLFGDDLG